MNSLISVIIPIYNGENYIESCLDSVLEQTYKNIEILLIDDGSEDSTATMCDWYVSIFEKVRYFHVSNGGPSAARNEGILNCRGDFVYFLDVDDVIEPAALELLAEQCGDVDWVIGDFCRVTNGEETSSGNELMYTKDALLGRDEVLSYIKKYLKVPYKYILFNHCWNRLYKVSILRKEGVLFNPCLRNLEDVDFNFKYLNYVEKVFFKKAAVYKYTIRKTSQSFVIGDSLYDVSKYLNTFKSIKTFLLNRSVPEEEVTKLVGHLFISYTAIILIRLCGNWGIKNSWRIYTNVKAIVNSKEVRKKLRFYSPTPNDIKHLHILIRYKMIGLTMMVCKRRFLKHRKF